VAFARPSDVALPADPRREPREKRGPAMTPVRSNEGIINYGSITADQIAAGKNALAMKVQSAADSLEARGLGEVRDRLQELSRLASENATQSKEHLDALRRIEQVAEALRAPNPDRPKIAEYLSQVVKGLKSLAKVSAAAAALKRAVEALL
jgi:hypothetical protein